MSKAASELVAALDDGQRAATMFPLAGKTRGEWSNVPYFSHRRPGLRIGALDERRKTLVHALLQASLSSQGYQKVAGVMRLDDINHVQQLEGLPPDANAYRRGLADSFGTDNYFVSLFGDPRSESEWAWLIQGHHLAISFTVAGDAVSYTPMFIGATPLAVDGPVETGWSALSHEVTRGFELLQSLTEEQLAVAFDDADVPGDVLNGVGNKHRFTAEAGLRSADMAPGQRRLLRALVDEYLRNADFDSAEAQLAVVEAAGWDRLTFTWRGSTDDPEAPFYYRVQGRRLIIECRSRGNHIHTIVRDPANDYGAAWLGLEYVEEVTAAERSAAAQRAAEAL